MNRHLTLGVLLLIVCCSTITINQEENKDQLIEAFVINKFSNAPIVGVLVKLLDSYPRITALSNSDGSLAMEDVPIYRQKILIE
jgi:hypothetical protein